MSFRRAVVFIVSLFSAVGTWADDDDSGYLDVQSGSLMGLVHASYGAVFAERHNVMVGVGYVPKLSYHREMMLYSLRYRYDHSASWDIAGMAFKPFSVGTGLLIGDHSDLFLQLPDKYPEGYYTPTAFRIVFNYQASLQVTPQLNAYFDMSILDVGLIGYVREPEFFNDNYDYLGLEGIANWGFGARYVF
ncbi:hypothetical protein ACU6U9_09965 [Pseudomonas sp. HK3]